LHTRIGVVYPTNYMENELLTGEQLRDKVESLWLKHIKLCQDNFLYFVQEVWPDFICRKEKDPKKWGHHQIIANQFTNIASLKKGRLIINMPNNLIQIVRNSLTETNANNEIEQASSNPLDTKLNYQFMYKQLESAVEEILIKYPNDDVVKELRGTVIRNLQPILTLLKNSQE